MKILRTVMLVACGLQAVVASAEDLRFTSTTNKDPIGYAVDEPMVFTITLVDHDQNDQPVTGRNLTWSRVGDDGVSESGKATSDKPLVITTSIAKPGFVRIRVNCLDSNGVAVSGDTHYYDGGAGADIWNIPQRAIPADFAEFWTKAVTKLKDTAYTTNRFEVCSENADYNIRFFELSTFAGERPATGYVVWPKNAAKRSLGIRASFGGYSAPTHQNPPGGNQSHIVVSVSRYGEDLTRTDAAYFSNIWTNDLASYCWRNNDKMVEDTDYYKMLMRDLRALQFVKSFAEWNGLVLETSGGSMGGYQSLGCAALDDDVSKCTPSVPWSADLSSVVDFGRMAGWRPTWTANLDYIDLKNLATLVRAPVQMRVGLGDYTCPPSGEAVMFRNLTCTPRTITFVQDMSHASTPHGVGSGETTVTIEGETRVISDSTLAFGLKSGVVTNVLDLTGGTLQLPDKVTVDVKFVGYVGANDYLLATAHVLTGATELELGEVTGVDRGLLKLYRRGNSIWLRHIAARGTFTLRAEGSQTLTEALAEIDELITPAELNGGMYAAYDLVIEGSGEILIDAPLTAWQGKLTVASGTLRLRGCAADMGESTLGRIVVKKGAALVGDSDIAGLWYGETKPLGLYENALAKPAYQYYMSNCVSLALSPFYEHTLYETMTNATELAKIVPWGNADYQRYKTWSGYLWNPSRTTETWTVVNTMNVYTRMILNGQSFNQDGIADGRAYGGVPRAEKAGDLKGLFSQITVQPGVNEFKVRYFNRWNAGYLWLGSCKTYLANGQPFENWPDGFGLMFDRKGRGSSNVADYEKFEDSGDGSLFVRMPCAAVFAGACESLRVEAGASVELGGGSLTVTSVSMTSDELVDDAAYLTNLTFGEGATLKVTGELTTLTANRSRRLLVARDCSGELALDAAMTHTGWRIEREDGEYWLVGGDAETELIVPVLTNQTLSAWLASAGMTAADLNGGKAAALNLVKVGGGVLTIDTSIELADWTGDLIIREGVVEVIVDANDERTLTMLGSIATGKVVVMDGATLDIYSKAAATGGYAVGMKRKICISGKGAAGYGGAIRMYGESGYGSIRAATPWMVQLDADAAISTRNGAQLVSESKTIDLQGHTLTLVGDTKTIFIESFYVTNPGTTGGIIIDGINFMTRATNEKWQGGASNRMVLRNGARFSYNGVNAVGHAWTLVYEASANFAYQNGTYASTDNYFDKGAWSGPVDLQGELRIVNSASNVANSDQQVQATTFGSKIGGMGGIVGSNPGVFAREILNLKDSGSDFSGPLTLTGYDLCLHAADALPLYNDQICLTDTALIIADDLTAAYHLGLMAFAGESRLDTGSGCTALTIDNLKVGAGVLRLEGAATRSVGILRGEGTLDLGGAALTVGTLYGTVTITNGALTVARNLGHPQLAVGATLTTPDEIVLNVDGSNTLAEALTAVTGMTPQPTMAELNGGAYATRTIRKTGAGVLVFDVGDESLNLANWKGDLCIEEGVVLSIVDASNAKTPYLLGDILSGAVYVSEGATYDIYSKASASGAYTGGPKRKIHIIGKGAPGYGGAIRMYGETGSSSIRAATPYALVLDGDASVAFRAAKDLVIDSGPKFYDLQGHALTFTNAGLSGTASLIYALGIRNPGATGRLIFDGVNCASRMGSDSWPGDAANRVVLRNGAYYNWNADSTVGSSWTLVYEETAGANIANGTAGRSAVYLSPANWLGPIQLNRTINLYDSTYTKADWPSRVQSFTFNGPITGTGGLVGDSTTATLNKDNFRRQILNLTSAGNDFTGPLNLKGYDLRLLNAAAMPTKAVVTLTDTKVILVSATNAVYELGTMTFGGESELTADFAGARATATAIGLNANAALTVDLDALEVGTIEVTDGYAKLNLGGHTLVVDEVIGNLFVGNGRLEVRSIRGEVFAADDAEIECESATQTARSNVFTFTEAAGFVANPGQGWMANSENNFTTLGSHIAIGDVYLRFDWKDIEPAEGQYDWTIIDRAIAIAGKRGLPVGLRIMCANSGSTTPTTPDWVWEKGAAYWEYESIDYSNNLVTNRSPHFEDPIFIECQRKCVEAMAKRYDGDSRIAGVDLGSYGNWGEWHCGKLPPQAPLKLTPEMIAGGYYDNTRFAGRSAETLDPELMKQYVDMYLDNFKKTPVMFMTEGRAVIEYAIGDGEVPRVGLRKDGIGSKNEATYKYWQDFYGHPIGDIWKYKPIWFEFVRDSAYLLENGVDLAATFNWMLTNHVSMLNVGPCGPNTLLYTEEHRGWLDMISKYAGARLVPQRIKATRRGEVMSIRFVGANKGVSRIYLDYVLTLSVRDYDGAVIYERDLQTDPTSWQPGEIVFEEDVELPAWVPSWACVALRIRDRSDQIRDFRFAVNELNADGSLPLGVSRPWEQVIRLEVNGEKTLAEALAEVTDFEPRPTIAELNGGIYANYDIVKTGEGTLKFDIGDIQHDLANWVGDLYVRQGVVMVNPDSADYRSYGMLGDANEGRVYVEDGATLDIAAVPQTIGKYTGGPRREIFIAGRGAAGMNGALRLYGYGSGSIRVAVPWMLTLVDDATVCIDRGAQLVSEDKTVKLNGHTLTIVGDAGTMLIESSYIVNPENTGGIILDGINFMTRATVEKWQGSAANRLVLRNDAMYTYNNSAAVGHAWTLVYETSANAAYQNGTHAVTNNYFDKGAWNGPVELQRDMKLVNYASGVVDGDNQVQATTFGGKISGTGGIFGRGSGVFSSEILNLMSGENDFSGPFTLTDFDLRLYSPTAMPEGNRNVNFTNVNVSIDFDAIVNSPVEPLQLGDANFVGDCLIQASGDLLGGTRISSVSAGALSVENGTLMIDAIGFNADFIDLREDGKVKFVHTDSPALSNVVGLVYGVIPKAKDAETSGGYVNFGVAPYDYRLVSDTITTDPMDFYCTKWGEFNNHNKAYRTYAGYLWNRTGTNATWSIMCTLNHHFKLTVGDETILYKAQGAPSNGAEPVPRIHNFTLQPGPNRFELIVANEYVAIINGVCNFGPVATNGLVNWEGDIRNCGFSYDPEGRGELNGANYRRFVIGGDEPLFTYLMEPSTRRIETIDGSGTVDLGGNELQVGVLDGKIRFVNGKVTADRIVGYPTIEEGEIASANIIRLDFSGEKTFAQALAAVTGITPQPTIETLNGGCHADFDIWKEGDGVLKFDINDATLNLTNWVGNLRVNAGVVEAVVDAMQGARTKELLGNAATGRVIVMDGATLDINSKTTTSGDGSGLQRHVYIAGKGASGYYGAIRLYGSGTASIRAVVPRYLHLLGDASISFKGNAQLVDDGKDIDLQGYTLTFTNDGNTGIPLWVSSMKMLNPGTTGGLVFDGVALQTRSGSRTSWQGGAANRVMFMNGGYFNWNSASADGYNWKLVYEPSATMRFDNGNYGVTTGVTKVGGWYGPMELKGTVRMKTSGYNEPTDPPIASRTQYTSFYGDISGAGGLSGDLYNRKNSNVNGYGGLTLTLAGTNTFLGPLALNGYTLRLLSDSALPAFNDHIYLSNTVVRLDGAASEYAFERVNFVGTSSIVTPGTKVPTITAERLSIAAGGSLSVGVAALDIGEVALNGGMLKVSNGNRGLVYGCHEYYNPYQDKGVTKYNAGYVPVGSASYPAYNYVLYSNNVTRLPGDFYTTKISAVFGTISCAYRTYSGYIWNDDDEPRQWTLLSTLNSRYRIKIGDDTMTRTDNQCPSKSPINATYHTFTLQPGANRFEFAIGNAYAGAPLTSFSATNNLENLSMLAPYCGLFIDRQGRGSLDIADYEPINTEAKVAELFSTIATDPLRTAETLSGNGTLDLDGGEMTVTTIAGDATVRHGTVYTRQVTGNPTTGEDGHIVLLEPRPVADTSFALPDGLLGKVEFAVNEQKRIVSRPQPLLLLDFSDPDSYKSDSAAIAYTNIVTDTYSFVRVGRDKNGVSHYGKRFGVCPKDAVIVTPGAVCTVDLEVRAPDRESQLLLYIQLLDANGNNISPDIPAVNGWSYSPTSVAFYKSYIDLVAVDEWVAKSYALEIPDGVAAVVPIITAQKGAYIDCRSLSVIYSGNRRGSTPVVFNTREERGDGSLVLTAEDDKLRLIASLRQDEAGAYFVTANVADLNDPPLPRAFDVIMNWPHDLTNWTNHVTWRTDEAILPGSSLQNVSTVSGTLISTYPFSAVSRDGEGVLVGTAFGPSYESRVVTAGGVSSKIPLGLLERQGRPGVGTSADLEWMLMRFANKRGMRSAMKAYYASQAKFLPAPKKDEKQGTWLFPTYPDTLPADPDDYGFAYWEGPDSIVSSLSTLSVAHQLGIGVFVYTECGGMRQTMTLHNDGSQPSEAEMLAELQSWAVETNTRATWFGAPRNIAAQACLNSMPDLPTGGHPFGVDFYSSWSQWWKTNPDPRLSATTNRAWLCWNYALGLNTNDIDGVYLDSLTDIDGYNNVRPDHLAVMDEPLIYDRETAQPCANGMHHLVAYVSQLGDLMHSMGKRLKGNAFGIAYRFHALSMDVCGSEVGSFGNTTWTAEQRDTHLRQANSDDSASMIRFYSYQRPIANLLQEGSYTVPRPIISEAGMTNYIENQMFYGFYPGVSTIGGEDKPGYSGWRRYFDSARQCERDRALFKRAIPIIRRMNRAQWVPETQLTVSTNAVLVEQYGAATSRDCLIAVRNPSDVAVDVVLVPDPELAAAVQCLKPLWHKDGETYELSDGKWHIHLEPWQTEVYSAYMPKPGAILMFACLPSFWHNRIPHEL